MLNSEGMDGSHQGQEEGSDGHTYLVIQDSTGSCSWSNKARKKKHTDRKGRNKTGSIYRWYDRLSRISQGIYNKTPELMSKCSKDPGYKSNTHKSIKLIYVNSNNTETEIENRAIYNCSKGYVYWGINRTKLVQCLYVENYKMLMKEKWEKMWRDGEIDHVHGLEQST